MALAYAAELCLLHAQRAQGAQNDELPAAHILQLYCAARKTSEATRSAHSAAGDALFSGGVNLATADHCHQLGAIG